VLIARDENGNVADEPAEGGVDVAAIDGNSLIVSTSRAGAGNGGVATTGCPVGIAQVQVQLDASASAFINGSVPSLGLSGSVRVTFVPGPVSTAASQIVASDEVAHGGGADVAVTLALVDECGAPLDADVTAAPLYGTVSDVVVVHGGGCAASFRLDASECHADPAEMSFYVDGTCLDVPFSLPTVCPEPSGPKITTLSRAAAIVGVP
jgi:hypothetical protein